MSFIYIILIAIPVFFFLKAFERMKRARLVKKNGVHVNAIVTQIEILQPKRGRTMDLLLMEYKDRATGQPYSAQVTVPHRKYQVGDNFPVIYLPSAPSMYLPVEKNRYVVSLILYSLLFVLAVFVVYKINDMRTEKHVEPILKVNGTPKL